MSYRDLRSTYISINIDIQVKETVMCDLPFFRFCLYRFYRDNEGAGLSKINFHRELSCAEFSPGRRDSGLAGETIRARR